MSREALSLALLIWGPAFLIVAYLAHPESKRMLQRARKSARFRFLARVQGGPIPPLEVRLTPYVWPGKKCRKAAAEFKALGFRRIGMYRMRPTSKRGIVLIGDEGRIVAEVWEGTMNGLFVSVYALSESGEVLELGGDRGSQHPNPPWHRMVETPGERRLTRMMEAFRAAEGWERPLLVTAANYPEVAATKRRRFMEWHLTHGRLRASMVPMLEQRTGMKADPAALEILRRSRP